MSFPDPDMKNMSGHNKFETLFRLNFFLSNVANMRVSVAGEKNVTLGKHFQHLPKKKFLAKQRRRVSYLLSIAL